MVSKYQYFGLKNWLGTKWRSASLSGNARCNPKEVMSHVGQSQEGTWQKEASLITKMKYQVLYHILNIYLKITYPFLSLSFTLFLHSSLSC